MRSDTGGAWRVMCKLVEGRRSCVRLAPHSGLSSMPGALVKAKVVSSKFLSCAEREEGFVLSSSSSPR